MLPYFREAYGNGHSLHSLGAQAREAVERARAQVATLLGAEDPSQVIFTSGATEANNQVLHAFAGGGVAYSPFEHSSVLVPAQHWGGVPVPNDGWDLLPPHDARLCSVMTVNNETGAMLSAPVLPHGTLVHRDITQQVGKLPLDLSGVAFASLSAHKLYGPKGVGALYCATGDIAPLLRGGPHEEGRRAGTLNVPAIVGFGEACRIALDIQDDDLQHAKHLRNIVLEEVAKLTDWRENSPGPSRQSPYILSLSFLGVEAEPLLHELDARGFQVGSGAACSSGTTSASHVLTALGYPDAWIRGTLRVSFGRSNSEASARALGWTIVETVRSVRNLLR